jgi:hypothetical protein
MSLALLAAAVAATVPGSFRAGAVCDHVDYATSASNFLRGQHLVINELAWRPYAVVDLSVARNWTGLNVDLFDRICAILGCTYNIRDMGYPAPRETWTELIVREQDHADVTGSWWVQSEERFTNGLWFRGQCVAESSGCPRTVPTLQLALRC